MVQFTWTDNTTILSFEQTTILITKQVGIQKDIQQSFFSEPSVPSLHKSYNE